ncbi:MAG: methionyl-tRNA formyltransferase [Fusicatenibacter sp.]|nr:methionyl-tRNA formyltransferase [Lachnospiraceae bacterium]MDY2938767.1 methionyl-tRNA formyltransferase [Fusicatenibacter sp.]
MKVVFMGTPDFSVGTLKAIADAGYEITGVITQPDKPKGRGKQIQQTPVKEAALALGLPVYQPSRVRSMEAIDTIRQMKPDVIVVVAFGQIIPKEILELPPLGCINVHASLLPAYRGAAPIQWAVINGEPKSGVTIMKMDEGLDTGDMLAKTEIPLEMDETGGSLFDKLSESGAKLLVDTLPLLAEGKITPEPQPEESTTEYARMIRKEDGHIDWTKSAVEIERLIRGMDPWPSAYTTLDGKILKIWKARVVAMPGGDLFSKLPGQDPKKSAGKIWVADESGIHVKTGDGILIIEELQLAGKKRMKTADFLRGYTVEPGTRLE